MARVQYQRGSASSSSDPAPSTVAARAAAEEDEDEEEEDEEEDEEKDNLHVVWSGVDLSSNSSITDDSSRPRMSTDVNGGVRHSATHIQTRSSTGTTSHDKVTRRPGGSSPPLFRSSESIENQKDRPSSASRSSSPTMPRSSRSAGNMRAFWQVKGEVRSPDRGLGKKTVHLSTEDAQALRTIDAATQAQLQEFRRVIEDKNKQLESEHQKHSESVKLLEEREAGNVEASQAEPADNSLNVDNSQGVKHSDAKDPRVSKGSKTSKGGRGNKASNADPLPSLGSAGHSEGTCSPCLFWISKRCVKGRHCLYCHIPHIGQKKKRIRPSKRTRELRKAVPSNYPYQSDDWDNECESYESPQPGLQAIPPQVIDMLEWSFQEMSEDVWEILPTLLADEAWSIGDGDKAVDRPRLASVLSRKIVDPLLEKFDQQSGHTFDTSYARTVLQKRVVAITTEYLEKSQ